MANNKVKHYRTDVAGRKPDASKMLEGEIAINMTDKSIFTKRGTEIVNIGNGADSIVEGGQTFIGDVQANKLKSDTDISLKNAEKSSIVFEDEHGKTKVELKSEKQTDAEGSLKVIVANGKNASTGYSTYDFVNGRLRLPVAPVEADNATRKDYVDSEIKKVSDASGTNLTALENKVNANDTKQTEANTELDNRLNSKIDLNSTTINAKVDANKADADQKILEVNQRLTVDNQTLAERIDQKVNKAGDTMTGDLNLPKLNADNVKVKYISVNTDNALGEGSISIGDPDTGLKWLGDGQLGFFSNARNVMNTENGYMQMNRLLNTRYVNDAGNATVTPPSGGSLIRNETWTDGNGAGDGNTHIGLADENGNYNHYFRGKGSTYFDTHGGVRIGVPLLAYRGTDTSPKAYGVYDSESLPTWTDSALQSNHLRKVRAKNADTIFHEAVIGHHEDSRARQSISWWHGTGPETFIASMQQDGTINATRFNTSAEYEAINLKTKNREAAYIRGTDGDKTSWLVGRLNPGDNRLIARSTIEQDGSSTVDLELDSGNKFFGVNVGGNRIAAFHNNKFAIDGRPWAATNGHAWADQWHQTPPVNIEFGDQSGASDYYPGYGLQSVSAGAGWPTRVELGMIRDNATDNGKGVLRVSSINEEGRKDIGANYTFDVYGRFAASGIVNTPRVETNQITSFGVNTPNVLGGNSIAFGDGDTGFRQMTDGNIEILSNSGHIGTFTPGGFQSTTTIGVSSPNDSRGVYVHNIRTGNANALIAGQVDGWADWGAWRDRPAGMITEVGALDKCVNVWKAVQWGTEWIAGMDVYNPSAGEYAAMLHVRGANYTFAQSGIASATSWVSTSDKRLKSNLEEVENAVEKVNKLTGYVYDKKSDLKETEYSFSVREAGLIAQELQEVLPEAVSSFGEDEILGVNPAAVNALLVNAIKELSADLKETNARLAALESAK
ncbi:tail fiber domain-containing protein [Escherichia coli]|nr:tail fiber domain-containing protein [Escherichia coli]